VKSDINNYIKKGKYATEMNPILYELFKEFDNYFSNSEMFVYTSYTHGDFQEGNLRIQDNRTIVIDWESSDKRFFLYDFYVLLGNPRHDKYLLNSYKTFKQQIRLLNDFPNEFINEKTMVLLFLEELKFYIYEENSVNYNTPPKRCKEIIIQLVSILSFLNFNKNKNNVKKCIYF
jgi:thiamine kinase-like enzyme